MLWYIYLFVFHKFELLKRNLVSYIVVWVISIVWLFKYEYIGMNGERTWCFVYVLSLVYINETTGKKRRKRYSMVVGQDYKIRFHYSVWWGVDTRKVGMDEAWTTATTLPLQQALKVLGVRVLTVSRGDERANMCVEDSGENKGFEEKCEKKL